MPVVIGIDLGTTYTCVAVRRQNGAVEVIKNLQGSELLPSVVQYDAESCTVGERAIEGRGKEPKNTIYQVKRLMGRNIEDEDIGARDYAFELIGSDRGAVNIRMPVQPAGTVRIACPEQVSAHILSCAKAYSEMHLKDSVSGAVITVPAHFTNAQREATIAAGEIAGLKVLGIVNEPTAAALAYNSSRTDRQRKRVILVYDLGGGTFDVSVVEMEGADARVKSTQGIAFLGGEDFDMRLYEHAVTAFKENDSGISTITESEKFALLQSCEKCKRALSTSESAEIETFFNKKRHTIVVTRETFEKRCSDLFNDTIESVKEAVKASGFTLRRIDDVVIVGGSSRIPRIRHLLADLFKDKELNYDIQPDFAVAQGAAILACNLADKPVSAAGGSSQPTNSSGGRMKLLDRTPYTLGIGLAGDGMDPLIPRNTEYPVSRVEYFSNGEANQTRINFSIYEGESAVASKNNLLGRLRIRCNPKPIGHNDIETTFSIDANGVLRVRVRDEETGKEMETTVDTSKMSPAEKNRMTKEARLHEQYAKAQQEMHKARAEFADALLRVEDARQHCAEASERVKLLIMASQENMWIITQDPTKEQIQEHTESILKRLDAMML